LKTKRNHNGSQQHLAGYLALLQVYSADPRNLAQRADTIGEPVCDWLLNVFRFSIRSGF
jgi:hypothetical protein